jgi:hypothetical protein
MLYITVYEAPAVELTASYKAWMHILAPLLADKLTNTVTHSTHFIHIPYLLLQLNMNCTKVLTS